MHSSTIMPLRARVETATHQKSFSVILVLTVSQSSSCWVSLRLASVCTKYPVPQPVLKSNTVVLDGIAATSLIRKTIVLSLARVKAGDIVR